MGRAPLPIAAEIGVLNPLSFRQRRNMAGKIKRGLAKPQIPLCINFKIRFGGLILVSNSHTVEGTCDEEGRDDKEDNRQGDIDLPA